MFKRHAYTCPDVIYLRNRQKKINRISLAGPIAFYGALWVYGTVLTRRDSENTEELAES